jgi:hypothetical protein
MHFSLQRQAEIRNGWLKTRLETILPDIMRREGLDMWIVLAREYNEDPVLMSLLPEPAQSARRRTLLVFALAPSGEFECLSLDRYGYPGFYTQMWTPGSETQAECLARVLAERSPARIGINTSSLYAFADGLSQGEYQWLMAALGDYATVTVSAERVCVGWLERRLPDEIAAYDGLVRVAHELIAETFSARVIHPGLTTTDDVVWALREQMQSLGVRAWFHPTVELQAPGLPFAPAPGMDKTPPRKLIQHGDLLHVDVGFIALGLATDHQQHAYVLRPGEDDAPDGLRAALAAGNRLQDILMRCMQVGKTGNEVLREALSQAMGEGIDAQIYSHPIGYHGHAAGPVIGLWDQQEGVPGTGDYPLYADTCYSIELNIKAPLPEWGGQIVRIALEEDAALVKGSGMRWLRGRQTSLHLIR